VKIPLVLHGASSVPPELAERINKYGGNIVGSFGVPIPSIQQAIARGVRKINVDTDTRMAMTGAVRQHLAEKPDTIDPREFMGAAREAVYEVVKSRMEAFGSAGHAGDYKPLTLADMIERYNR